MRKKIQNGSLRRSRVRYPRISSGSRLVSRGRTKSKIKREGVTKFFRSDLYATSLGASWPRLVFSIIIFYLGLNAFFAGLYLLQDGSIENARPGSFHDAFFFSVQTLATIGYGKMIPATTFANILVTVEALTGLAGLAIATGVIFSKISRPKARILFGNEALISSYKNAKCFMFRLGNLRTNPVADPEIQAVLIQDELDENGDNRRVFHDLPLARNSVPLLMPSWTARHIISKESPLFNMTNEMLEEKNVEIIVSITGFDETLSQTVHAHHSYIAEEIIFGGQFSDIISWNKNGDVRVDYKRFHDIRHTIS